MYNQLLLVAILFLKSYFIYLLTTLKYLKHIYSIIFHIYVHWVCLKIFIFVTLGPYILYEIAIYKQKLNKFTTIKCSLILEYYSAKLNSIVKIIC